MMKILSISFKENEWLCIWYFKIVDFSMQTIILYVQWMQQMDKRLFFSTNIHVPVVILSIPS